MATYSGRIRRGLPRDSSGEPWPPVEQEIIDTTAGSVSPASEEQPAAAPPVAAAADAQVVEPVTTSADDVDVVRAAEAVLAEAATATEAGAAAEVALRQGLPREAGGGPWPPVTRVDASGAAAFLTSKAVSADADDVRAERTADAATRATVTPDAPAQGVQPAAAGATSEAAPQPQQSGTTGSPLNTGTGEPLRRGLPRAKGGEPWPPAGLAPSSSAVSSPTALGAIGTPAAATEGPQTATDAPTATNAQAADASAAADSPTASKSAEGVPASRASESAAATSPATARAEPPAPKPAASKPADAKPAAASSPPVSGKPTAKPKTAQEQAKPVRKSPAKKEPTKYGSRTIGQWARLVALVVLGAIAAAGIIVLAARGLTTFPAVQNFLAQYPGEYELPEAAEEGFPAWVRWSHFLNMFFIVLIIRSGLLVRQQQKPPAFWSPKNGKGSKISINLWLHQSLDVLWLINGVTFVVLLFVSSHWMRIVPTSWEVFPNALSALIQYLTLDWPVENGWVNYNSLQQLMYFTVVFIAAPLAAITGARLSDLWPKNAKRLNKIYPVEVARALHFPTMLFFVVFVIAHVTLVFATGALRNLNHMYAGTPEVSWAGFWLFAGSIALVAIVWAASRPILLAPIASLFGKVSSR